MTKSFRIFFGAIGVIVCQLSFGQYSGTYTVGGSSSDFPSLDSAFNSLEKKGINGNVRLNVRSGTYKEQTTISSINGANNTSLIRVGPDPKNKEPVIFKYKITNPADNYIINVKQGFLEFDSIEFRVDSSSVLGRIISFTAACENITFKGCTFYGKDSSSATTRFAILFDTASVSINNYNIFDCTFYNGSCAIFHFGDAKKFELNTLIKNNRIYNYFGDAIRLYYQKAIIIQGNYTKDINRNKLANGITIGLCDSLTILENKVYLSGGSGYGIGLMSVSASAKHPNLMINNFIEIYDATKISPDCSGLMIYSGTNNSIYNNTILIRNKSKEAKGIYIFQNGSYFNGIIKNNNIVNIGGGCALHLASTAGITSIDFNNYYTSGPSLGFYGYSGFPGATILKDLAAIRKTTGMDSNSICKNVFFTGINNVHTYSKDLDSAGTPIGGINIDMDGETRNSKRPDIGADEFNAILLDASLIDIKSNYCPGNQNVPVIIMNTARSVITKIKIDWQVSINGGSFTNQTPYNYSGSIKELKDTSFNIGTYSFSKGNSYKIKAWISNINDTSDGIRSNDTLTTVQFITGLNGKYTIGGSNPDFPNIDSAFNTLERNGVCGPVRLNLRSGTYKEQTVISSIPNISSTNPVTLGPDPANSSTPVIAYGASAEVDNFIIKFKGASYISIDSIAILADGNSFLGAVVFEGLNTNISLLNDSISGSKNLTDNSYFYSVIYDNMGIDHINNYLTIKDCKISNGSYGIFIYGISMGLNETGSRIINNQITDFSAVGIQASYQSDIVLLNNVLKNSKASPGGVMGLLLGANDTFIIMNNQVYLSGNISLGINLYNSNCSAKKPGIFANNTVSLSNFKATNWIYGMYLGSGTFNKIVNNSVNVFGGPKGSVAFNCNYKGSDSVEIFNNNFINSANGISVRYENGTVIKKSDYNNYYTNGATMAIYNNQELANLKDLQNAIGLEAHSVSSDPQYFDTLNLHASNASIEGNAIPLSYLKEDMDGQKRDSVNPDIGADEFDLAPNDIGILKFLESHVTNCGLDSTEVSIIITNAGSRAQTNFKVNIDVMLDSVFTFSDSVIVSDTLHSKSNDTIIFKKFNSYKGGYYSFKAYTNLTNDTHHENDKSSIARIINSAPAKPEIQTDTICSNMAYNLTTKFPAKTYLRWYDSNTGGKLLAEKNIFPISKLKRDTSFYMVSVQHYQNSNSLTTTLSPKTVCGGEIMFDLIPRNNLNLDSFITFFGAIGVQTVYVYMKKGTFKGFESLPKSWTSIDTIKVQAVSTTQLTNIPLKKSIMLSADSVYAFCLFSPKIEYLITPDSKHSNSDIMINNGRSGCALFNSRIDYGAFIGRIFYSRSFECESNRVPYKLKVNIAPVVYLGKDTGYCANSGIKLKLNAGTGPFSYKWSTMDTGQTIIISKEGNYSVTVIDTNNCSTEDKITITKNQNPIINIGNDTSYCVNTAFNYTLNAGPGFKSYKWNSGSVGQTMQVSNAGIYSIIVSNDKNCEAMDTLLIKENKRPLVDLGKDTTYCANDGIQLVLDAGAGHNKYNWSTLAGSQTINIKGPGKYSVNVTNNSGCIGNDTIFVFENKNPILNIGKDTSYCSNDPISKKLDAGAGYLYNWSTGSNTQSVLIKSTGIYYVNVKDQYNCAGNDSIIITSIPNPIVSLGADRIVNPALPINEILDAGPGFISYEWSNSDLTQAIRVNSEGLYFVKVTDINGCTGIDSIIVKYGPAGLSTLANYKIKVYPNPAKDLLNIVSTNSVIEKTEVFETNGKSIYKSTEAGNEFRLNTNNWANGIYIIAISYESKTYKIKVSVLH